MMKVGLRHDESVITGLIWVIIKHFLWLVLKQDESDGDIGLRYNVGLDHDKRVSMMFFSGKWWQSMDNPALRHNKINGSEIALGHN